MEKQNEEKKEKYEIVEETFGDLQFEKDEISGGYDEVYFVKPKTKDVAYFEFSKKVGDKIHKDPRTTIQTIDGDLIKIELDSYTYENKEIKTIKLHIKKMLGEKSVLFIISSSFTQVARSMMNSLLGCKVAVEKVNITLYINHSGYTSVKFSINGKKSEWLYSIAEQKKFVETITNKKGEFVSNDYSDLDDVFVEKMREHLIVLFPDGDNIKFVEEALKEEEAKLESTFGDAKDAADFFNIE